MKSLLLLLLSATACHADNLITLGWDPVPGAAGYKVYAGRSTNTMTNTVDAGTNLMVTITAPMAYQLAFAVTSYDGTEESVQSSVMTTNLIELVPHITMQPKGTTNAIDELASFEVIVDNQTPVTWQWRFQGTNAPGTNNVFTFPVLLRLQGGIYSVIISNALGRIESQKAKLTINP